VLARTADMTLQAALRRPVAHREAHRSAGIALLDIDPRNGS
jgi:hypothetical protein